MMAVETGAAGRGGRRYWQGTSQYTSDCAWKTWSTLAGPRPTKWSVRTPRHRPVAYPDRWWGECAV